MNDKEILFMALWASSLSGGWAGAFSFFLGRDGGVGLTIAFLISVSIFLISAAVVWWKSPILSDENPHKQGRWAHE